MKSKVQKAILAEVKSLVDAIETVDLRKGREGHEEWEVCYEYAGKVHPVENFLKFSERVAELVKEYELEDKLFKEAVEKTYDKLMRERQYLLAASLAKKHEL